MIHVIQQEFCAGSAVASRMVMIEFDAKMAAHRTEFVVLNIRVTLAPHRAGAGIIRKGAPIDLIPVDAFGQNAHIEGGVVGDQQAAVHERPDLFPKLGEVWFSFHCFRSDPCQPDIEIIEMGLGIHQSVSLVDDPSIFDDRDPDRADPIVIGIWRFHIKCDKSVVHGPP